eukprot:10918935-Ditylum_brightwellii.AAC.1
MACHSLNVAITVVAEQTRSRTVFVIHSSGSTVVRFVFLITAANIKRTKFIKDIFLSLVESSGYLGINERVK